jgi:hypothetical protein
MKNRRVRLRTWVDLQDEYGLSEDLDQFGNAMIDCPKKFTQDLERYLPKDRIVEIFQVHEGDWKTLDEEFWISEEMIAEEITYFDLGDLICKRERGKRIKSHSSGEVSDEGCPF